MAIRFKSFTPMTVFKAQEANDLANNGVIQVSTYNDLDDPSLELANLAYVLDEHSLRMRVTPGVGKANWSAPFSSRRRQQGVTHTGVGAFTVDNYDPTRTYVLSNGNTVAADGSFSGSGQFTLEVRAGVTLLKTFTIETRAYRYQTVGGGSYQYDCSYGARAEQYQSGTTNKVVTGDRASCAPYGNYDNCGGNCYVPGTNCTAPIGKPALCPGGWYLCGDRCCTNVSEPVYSTRYHCDSGGTLSGTTCIKSCTGTNPSQQQLVNEPGFTNDNGEWWKVDVS
jgi:hypothetical protein